MGSIVEDKKKYFGSIAFLAALIGFTFYMFLKDNALSDLLASLQKASPFYVMVALGMMFLFILSESYIIKVLLNSLGKSISIGRCVKYSFIGFYFSSITPSASGGQPAQVYYMKKDGINVSLSSLTLLITTALYQLVMLLIGGVMFLWKADFVTENVKGIGILLVYGVAINLILLGFIFAVIFSDKVVRRFVLWCARLFHKIKIVKNLKKVEITIDEQIEEYRQGAQHIRKHPKAVLKAFGATIIQLGSLTLVPFFIYKAFGLNEYSVIEIVAVQSLLTIAVSSLPLPGAVGASEGGFLLLFKLFFGANLVLPGMLLSRGVSYYAMLLISGAVMIIAQICMGRKKQNARVTLLKKTVANEPA